MIPVLLILASLPIWVASFGFARLRSPFDRLHCASLAAAASGPLVAVLAFVADGASDRAFKILLVVILLLVNGAALSHAIARTIAWRDSVDGQP